MAKIDKVPVRMGKLIHVENTSTARKFNELETYVSVWLSDADGKNKRCVLFTDGEIERAERRAAKNPEDLTKRSLISKIVE